MDVFFVFLLLFTEILLLGIAWYIFKGDFASPSVVTLALFILSTACFAYNTKEWIVVFTFKAYMLFTLSFILMIATEKFFSTHSIALFGKRLIKSRTGATGRTKYSLHICKQYDNILFLVFMLCALYYIYQVYRTGMAMGATSFIHAIGFNKEEGDYNAVARLAYNLIRVASYVYIVIFANNVFVCKESIQKNRKSLCIIITTLIIAFFSGQRSSLICHVVSIIVAIKISLYDAQKTGIKVNIRKFFKRLIIVAVMVVALFYASANVVKGTNIQRYFIDYITYYFGSTTALMGRIVENPSLCHTPFVGYFGEKTFNGFWRDMHSFGLVSSYPTDRLWIRMGGSVANRAGNEFTFLCAPYIDFGFVGTLVFIVLFYSIFSYFYYQKIRNKDFSLKKYTNCAIYIWLYAMVAMSFYQDTIRSYTRLINIAYLLYIIIFCKLFLRLQKVEKES